MQVCIALGCSMKRLDLLCSHQSISTPNVKFVKQMHFKRQWYPYSLLCRFCNAIKSLMFRMVRRPASTCVEMEATTATWHSPTTAWSSLPLSGVRTSLTHYFWEKKLTVILMKICVHVPLGVHRIGINRILRNINF